jgi:hypothetical protein
VRLYSIGLRYTKDTEKEMEAGSEINNSCWTEEHRRSVRSVIN